VQKQHGQWWGFNRRGDGDSTWGKEDQSVLLIYVWRQHKEKLQIVLFKWRDEGLRRL
jgi:hypothetical protein